MVTQDELCTISVFSALEPADLERLCRVAADISLSPGEYAGHDGDERALFALLEGRIEIIEPSPVATAQGEVAAAGERRREGMADTARGTDEQHAGPAERSGRGRRDVYPDSLSATRLIPGISRPALGSSSRRTATSSSGGVRSAAS